MLFRVQVVLTEGLLVHAPAQISCYPTCYRVAPFGTVISYVFTYHLDNLSQRSNNINSEHLNFYLYITHLQINI